MAETKTIIHIETTDLGNLDLQQLGVTANPDSDLNFRIWGGKDSQGDVTYWLAKDKAARIASLIISGITGSSGVLQHNASGIVTGQASANALSDVTISSPADGQLLVYDAGDTRWENVDFNLGDLFNVAIATPTEGQVLTYNSTSEEWENADSSTSSVTLDDCYNNDTGVRLITADDGYVTWDLNATDARFNIEIDTTSGDDSGFYVIDEEQGHYMTFRKEDLGEGQWGAAFRVVESTGQLSVQFDCDAFNVTGGPVSITSSSTTLIGGANYLQLRGYNTTTDFNQSGDLSLDGSFTAWSIIGALNELKSDITGHTLDEAYNAQSGVTHTVQIDDGDLNFDLYGTDNIRIYESPTVGTVNDLLTIHADSTNWNAGSNALKIISDDSACRPLLVDDGSGTVAYIAQDGSITCTGLTLGNNDVITASTGYFLLGSAASPARIAQLTTTERNSLSAVNGLIIYNTTDNKFQGYENGAWVNFV